ncbi:F0F1 ATP synthase subunit delta [Nocardioides mangrovicus]|uniref:ATP synthase subunit delta n=1 Tax=Nocardioides mangrovicus TaxID=2478913 RepID=A0A3L8P875_9ACTN|nr:F0F1 ATP synthase subunit delta [Nocardioides mangrovicus]RLV51033.1 F0F1 ATP synthase subunit delta [Nocardioides mangrovicus]
MINQLRGASAEALEALSDQLGTSTLADSATLGEELFGLAVLLRSEAGLRRAVTDPSVDADARAGIVTAVLTGKIGDKALGLITDAVTRRWTSPRDLADALERLAVVATVRSAGKADGPKVGDELFSVGRLVETERDLYSALTDPARTAADRSGLLTGLIEARTLPATQTLVRQAVLTAASGQGNVDGVLADYQRIAAAAQDEVVAVVRTARELRRADVERLTTALGKAYATTVQLHVVVEPELVGGLRVEIADDVIDGTVVTRLDEARRKIAG